MDNHEKRENRLSISHFGVGQESEPYDLFVFAINAEQTRQKYITRMKKFLGIIGIDQETDPPREVQVICQEGKVRERKASERNYPVPPIPEG